MMEGKINQKGLHIHSHLPPEAVLVKGDLMRVKQVLVNLLGNAIKFTHVGTIDVGLVVKEESTSQTLVQISLTDTGIGLSKLNISKLFQRFSQAVGETYGGSGLGLYLIKELVHMMGGTIDVKSVEGIGSTFTVTIPFAPLDDELVPTAFPIPGQPERLAIARGVAQYASKRTILVRMLHLCGRPPFINHQS